MKALEMDFFINTVMKTMCDTIVKNEVKFCDLDSVAGDGDFGMSLAKGFKEVLAQWDTLKRDSIGAFLRDASMVITEYCGGATGPLWGSAFRSAALKAGNSREVDLQTLREMLSAGIEAIQRRGGAAAGDKTMLDALIPAAESLGRSFESGQELSSACVAAAKAAVEGAERTKEMVARRGRASYSGERSLSYPDAGAVAIGVIFTDIAAAISAVEA